MSPRGPISRCKNISCKGNLEGFKKKPFCVKKLKKETQTCMQNKLSQKKLKPKLCAMNPKKAS